MSTLNESQSFFTSPKTFCVPAMIYLLLSIISTLLMAWNVSFFTITIKIIFVLLWATFLNYLCSNGYSSIAWFLVLLPFVFFILMMFIALEVFDILLYQGLIKADPSLSLAPMQPMQPMY